MARHDWCTRVLLGKLSRPPSVSKVVFLPRIRVLWFGIVVAFQGLWQNKGNWLCVLGGVLCHGWVNSEQAGPVWMSPPCLVTAAEWGRVGLWQLLIWEVFGSQPLPEVLFHYNIEHLFIYWLPLFSHLCSPYIFSFVNLSGKMLCLNNWCGGEWS